jgi:hypothetical protein
MLGIKARTTIAVVLVAAAIGAIGAGAPSANAYKCPSTDPCGSVESLEHKCQLLGELNQSEAKANEAYAKEGNMAGANETAENLDRGHQLEETYGCHDGPARVAPSTGALVSAGLSATVLGAVQRSPQESTTVSPTRAYTSKTAVSSIAIR